MRRARRRRRPPPQRQQRSCRRAPRAPRSAPWSARASRCAAHLLRQTPAPKHECRGAQREAHAVSGSSGPGVGRPITFLGCLAAAVWPLPRPAARRHTPNVAVLTPVCPTRIDMHRATRMLARSISLDLLGTRTALLRGWRAGARGGGRGGLPERDGRAQRGARRARRRRRRLGGGRPRRGRAGRLGGAGGGRGGRGHAAGRPAVSAGQAHLHGAAVRVRALCTFLSARVQARPYAPQRASAGARQTAVSGTSPCCKCIAGLPARRADAPRPRGAGRAGAAALGGQQRAVPRGRAARRAMRGRAP